MLIVRLNLGTDKPSIFSWVGHQPYPINCDSLTITITPIIHKLLHIRLVRYQIIIPATLNHTDMDGFAEMYHVLTIGI